MLLLFLFSDSVGIADVVAVVTLVLLVLLVLLFAQQQETASATSPLPSHTRKAGDRPRCRWHRAV